MGCGFDSSKRCQLQFLKIKKRFIVLVCINTVQNWMSKLSPKRFCEDKMNSKK